MTTNPEGSPEKPKKKRKKRLPLPPPKNLEAVAFGEEVERLVSSGQYPTYGEARAALREQGLGGKPLSEEERRAQDDAGRMILQIMDDIAGRYF